MKKPIIDFIRWSGDIGVLAYRHPQANISKYAKLQVNDAQEAVIVVNGTKSQKFGPGQYDLDSPNLPILRAFYGFPFGGENPWTVQAWFVNKLTPKDVDWAIGDFPIFDQTQQVQVPVEAHGRYGITVADAEKLIMKLALGFPANGEGAVAVTANDFTEQLRGELTAKTKSLITKVFQMNGYGIFDISAHLNDISTMLESELTAFFDEFGCKLSKFYVMHIGVDTSTESGRMIQEAINRQSYQKMTGSTWQQSRMFDTMEQALTSGGNGGGGGIMGAVLMSGMLGGMGGNNVGGMMAPTYNQPVPNTPYGNGGGNGGGQQQQQAAPQQMIREVYCADCSHRFTSDKNFCPKCGKKYNPCPKCGADNDQNATRCVSCASQLTAAIGNVCPNCNTAVAPGSTFCPACGRRMVENKCPRCGGDTKGAAFCPNCGMKQN